MAPEKIPTEEETQAQLEDHGKPDANLSMSDDDFMNMSEADAIKAMEAEEQRQEEEAAKTPEELEEEQKKADEAKAAEEAKQAEDAKKAEEDKAAADEKDDDPEKDADEDNASETDEEAAEKLKQAADDADKADPDKKKEEDLDEKKEDEVDPKKEEKKKEKVDKDSEIDYKAEYLKLTAPFKANGTEMAVKSTEDAIKLMQMGANYHKKMAGLKPSLKLLKLLENNELLDVGKLNFLIDLKKGNPEAIKKLVKDNGIDPLDINTKEDVQYTPTARTVDDKEIELDEVLRSIKDTPHYTDTLNVITKSWDDKSRAAAANEPQIIATINAQMADGTYKAVSDAVLYERSMGRLVGLSDLDAYKKVGHDMGQAGELPFQQKAEQKPSQEADVKKETPSKEVERQTRKKKVATVKKTGGTDTEPTFNPLDMSDEDFEKFDINSVPE
jgi:hypothetical protein